MPKLSFAAIKERKLVQWTLTYLAVGWAGLQLLDYIVKNFSLPDALPRVGLVLYATGIVITLIVAWYHGERGGQEVTKAEIFALLLTITIGGGAIVKVSQANTKLHDDAVADMEGNAIAVLPFANRSNDPQNEYFSDGITEEIMSELARIPNLHVRPRTSTFAFKNKEIAAADIAGKLRVRYILEGSVQRAGDQVRIAARLVDAANDQTVWSDQFDRPVHDVFAVEDEISRAIAEKLRLRLTDVGAGARTTNPEAHELYLRGRYLLGKSSNASILESWSYFERAIALDSTYAAAYAGLAEAYTLSTPERKTADMFDKARAMAQRSLALDEQQAEVHAVLGALLLWRDWDLVGSEREFKRALALNPNYANTYDYYAWVLMMRGDMAGSVRMAEEAVRVDPFSAWLSYALEFRYVNARQYDRAIAQHKITLALDPDQFYWDLPVGIAYREKREYDKSVAEYKRVLDRIGQRPVHGLAVTYARMGKISEARAILKQLEDLSKTAYVQPEQLAIVYANLGEKDKAFEMLEISLAENDGWLMGWIAVDPSYDAIRSDPRFADLMRRIRDKTKY